MARIINLLSGPRNISTALMYSFAQREDIHVVDEPFYGYYLVETGVDHPGRDLVLKSMATRLDDVLAEISSLASRGKTVFLKNMGHHMIMKDHSFLLNWENVFLIRNPKQLIASIACILENPEMRDIALKRQYDLYRWLISSTSKVPPIMDSSLILMDPEAGLRRFCEALNLPFDPKMLNWPEGPRPEDGIWAKWWYKSVHHSTGFIKQPTSSRPLPKHCEALYKEARPYYDFLLTHSIS